MLFQVEEYARFQAMDIILFHAEIIVMLFDLVSPENLDSSKCQLDPEPHHLLALLLSSIPLFQTGLRALLQGFQNIFERGLPKFDICNSF